MEPYMNWIVENWQLVAADPLGAALLVYQVGGIACLFGVAYRAGVNRRKVTWHEAGLALIWPLWLLWLPLRAVVRWVRGRKKPMRRVWRDKHNPRCLWEWDGKDVYWFNYDGECAKVCADLKHMVSHPEQHIELTASEIAALDAELGGPAAPATPAPMGVRAWRWVRGRQKREKPPVNCPRCGVGVGWVQVGPGTAQKTKWHQRLAADLFRCRACGQESGSAAPATPAPVGVRAFREGPHEVLWLFANGRKYAGPNMQHGWIDLTDHMNLTAEKMAEWPTRFRELPPEEAQRLNAERTGAKPVPTYLHLNESGYWKDNEAASGTVILESTLKPKIPYAGSQPDPLKAPVTQEQHAESIAALNRRIDKVEGKGTRH